MSTTTYGVTGLTCGHCVNAVTEEVSALPGVTEASVDLNSGGTSTLTITTQQPVSREDLLGAVKEAGEDYELADA